MVQGVPQDPNNPSDPVADHVESKPDTVKPTKQPEMTGDQNEDVKSTRAQASPTMGTLHLLSYLLWEREGVETFEVTRAQLLDTITLLTENLRTSNSDAVEQIKHVILGGQTVLIEDIAAVRTDLLALMSIYNAGGRFGMGPWYIQVDNMLVSGESLIRNLLLGRADVVRHGIELMDTGFMPSSVQHVEQLPQILAGFDISAILLTTAKHVTSIPFRWVAPDGSDVLVITHYETDDLKATLDEQQLGQPDGPFLWLNTIESDHELTPPIVSSEIKQTVIQSTLSNYVAASRKALPDALRPVLRGELSLLGPGYQAGRFSTRLYLKQANVRLQSLLTSQTEPWLAIALTHSQLPSTDNLRALLDHSWRELMKNQSRNNLTGCSHDTVTQETEIRNQRILDVTQRIQDKSLDALPGTLTRTTSQRPPRSDETYIGVWNSHSYPVEQVVKLDLQLPDGLYPSTLLDHENKEINFSWQPDETDTPYACQIYFRAKVNPVGYSVYTLKLSDNLPESHHDINTTSGNVIGNVAGETLLVEKGQLVWARDKQRITDFLSFHDGGDAGDTYNYRKPQPDVMVRAGMTDMVNVQTTATYERLIFRQRMRIAPELKDDLSRARGLSLLDITTTATFYDNIPGIYFRTTFTNKAKDHRLRARFRTEIKSDHILTDSAFGLTRHPILKGSQVASNPQLNIVPMQSLTAVESEQETLVMMSQGLSEVEPILEKDEITLALTLLRSVGWIRRGTDNIPGIPVKGAQYERDISVDYAIVPIKEANPAKILQTGQMYISPLQVFQYHEKPDPIQNSYLTFESDRAIMTALKPPQIGKGWIVRFYNPTDEEISSRLTTQGKLTSAKLVNLAEEDKAEYTIAKNHINVKIPPHKIHTLRLEFDQ